MSRPSPGGSRIPSVRTSFRPTSTLGKRPAAEASLSEDPAATRRALTQSVSKQNNLERKILELEKQIRQRDQDVEDQRIRIETLTSERRILLEGETHEKRLGEERERAWAQEKKRLVEQLNKERRKATDSTAELSQVHDKYTRLSAQYVSLKEEYQGLDEVLNGRIEELEGDVSKLKGYKKKAEDLAVQLTEEKRKAEDLERARRDAEQDRRGEEVVRKELNRQAQHVVTLQKTNDKLQSEVSELRRFRKEAEATESHTKELEQSLRAEIRSLNEQLERARREVDALTKSSSGSSSEEVASLQSRLSSLSSLHQETEDQLVAEKAQTSSLHARLSKLASDAQQASLTLSKRAEEAERELRWAREGRRSAEVREELARKELEALRNSGGDGGGDPNRVQHLEGLLEQYKEQLAEMQRDSRDVESRLAGGQGLVQRQQLEDEQRRVEALKRDIENLNTEIDSLTANNEQLNSEVTELMKRVASGEFNPARERCLELAANPAAKVRAVRTQQLEELKTENAALLERLAGNGEAVPLETYQRLEKEKAELEQAHAKRLMRLKEIFGVKSREILEAVYSLLGWRIKFDENGQDIRLASMYAPKGRMGLALKFTSQEGHFGTMQMSGALARGLEEARHFWVTERQSIPGFLAQVTSELFEKTTMGRAAGYVGLE